MTAESSRLLLTMLALYVRAASLGKGNMLMLNIDEINSAWVPQLHVAKGSQR